MLLTLRKAVILGNITFLTNAVIYLSSFFIVTLTLTLKLITDINE